MILSIEAQACLGDVCGGGVGEVCRFLSGAAGKTL
jgi:hypothetical protein